MINANVIFRVIRIRTDKSVGTAFILDADNRDPFLVTAAHVLPPGDPDPVVHLRVGHAADEFTTRLKLLPVSPDGLDLAVAEAEMLSGIQTFPLPPSDEQGPILGQDLFFLGFPLGLDGTGAGAGLRFPLVKKAVFSGVDLKDGWSYLVLDGHNNRGFSGGPVVGHTLGSPSELRVVGVINSYFLDEGANSGIIIATSIKHAVDAIAAARASRD